MGLAERRGIEEFKNSKFEALRAEVTQAAGFAVPIEVDWDSIAADGQASLYDEAIPKVFFEPLAGALREVGRDDLGKAALEKSLKKIELCNRTGTYGESAITFHGGVLKIDHETTTNIDDVDLRKDAIVSVLSNAL